MIILKAHYIHDVNAVHQREASDAAQYRRPVMTSLLQLQQSGVVRVEDMNWSGMDCN